MIKIKLLLLIVLVLNLYSNEVVALLKSIENNHQLHLRYKQTPFLCKPYGVETISQLVQRTDINSSCMQYLDAFRIEHPKERFFAEMTLKLEQQYSVEGIGSLCLLFLSSEHSYSEALLEEGYAHIPMSFRYDDPILEYRFKRAIKGAKVKKVGMWSDIKVKNCFLATPSK
ncbi:hypothetical protein JHD50_12875 [Sulfurimonas sp. MAG313]|nr:hypothetical protein [Sulfurimonas sp. MAG313]MDF1882181.1 hypothetical protein [Sulfurimonas sp. MAG313]